MKTIQEIVESGATVDVSPDRVKIITPDDFEMPPGGLHIRWPDPPLDQEARMMDYKWYAALAYVRANKLNYNVIEGPNDRFGLIASGKAYNDTRSGPARPRPGRRHLPPPRHPPAQGQCGVAAGSDHHPRLRHRPAGNPRHRREAPGHRIPDQGRALQLAPRRAPERDGQVRGDRGRHERRRVEPPQPQPTAGCCAPRPI